MTHTLKQRALHGMFWSFAESIGNRVGQFILTIILARLLLPADYGLIGMLSIFTLVAQALIDSGFGQALIQKPSADELDICSVFYFSIFIGAITTLLLMLAAPWIAAFYNQPRLALLTRVLSLSLLINSFGLIQSTYLSKQIDFRSLMLVSLLATFVSGIVGIGMAYAGHGVWSLVGQTLSAAWVRTAALWKIAPWRPTLHFSLQRLRALFGFGSRMLATGLLYQICNNLYALAIGRLFSAAELGYYTRAQSLQSMPMQGVVASLQRVAFPVFAQLQNDTARFRNGFVRALELVLFANLLLMTALIVTARPLVTILLTTKWLPCVPYFQILCVAGMFYPFHLMNLSALAAKGRSNLVLKVELIKNVMTLAAIIITFRYGILAMIIGQTVNSALFILVNGWYSGQVFDLSIQRQMVLGARYFMTALGAGVLAAWAISHMTNDWAALLLGGGIVTGSYLMLAWALRVRALDETIQQIRQLALSLGMRNKTVQT